MKTACVPGVSTAELDSIAGAMLEAAGAVSAPRFFYDFPGHTCISVNEHAAHGIPSQRRVVAEGDAARHDICAAVADAVRQAITQVKPGRSLNVTGKAVQEVADARGYNIVRNLGSHGVGRSIHEEPSYVPVDNPQETRRLHEGMVFTIEPFFTTGQPWVEELADGWTLAVEDSALVAQFEHTIMVTRTGAEILTA